MSRGYFKVADIRGTLLRVHWSLPAGGVIVCLIGQVDPRQWIWYCLASTALIAVHEAGHVFAALAFRLRIFSVEISGLGGLCRFERPRATYQGLLVISAGLLAQLAVLLPTLAFVISRNGFPEHPVGRAFCITFTILNAVLLVINLIPLREVHRGIDTDGAQLWRLFLHVFMGHRHPQPPLVAMPADQAPVFPAETSLLKMRGFKPPGFVHGIELLNDRTTPMEFVMNCFVTHLGLTESDAAVLMLEIHNTGGALVPRASQQEARRIADEVAAAAREAGHAFICRYVGEPAPYFGTVDSRNTR